MQENDAVFQEIHSGSKNSCDFARIDRSWRSRGIRAIRESRYDEAILAFDECLRLADTEWPEDPRLNRGACYGELHDHQKALLDFDAIISQILEPTELDGDSYALRGLVKADLARHEEASVDFTAAIALYEGGLAERKQNPGLPGAYPQELMQLTLALAYACRAISYEFLGKNDLATEDTRKAQLAGLQPQRLEHKYINLHCPDLLR